MCGRIRTGAEAPQPIDPETFAFFDAITGKARVWYWRGTNGEYEFYDNPGFHPRTGEPLTIITKEAIASWKRIIEALAQRRKDEELRRANEQREKTEREKRDRETAQAQQQAREAELTAAQERQQQAGSLCDQLASNPTDPRKPADVPGTRFDDLRTNATAAAEACALAMRVYPAEIRFRYQYARALQIDQPQKAFELHKQLVHDGYLASYDNAGGLLINTYKNIPDGIKYFKEGVRRGDPDSMVSLADLIDRHYVPENDPVAARFTLLSRAAQLGHPGAQLAVERERNKFQQLQQQREFQQQQGQVMMQMFGTILQHVAR